MVVVRELTGGLYFGEPKKRDQVDGHMRAVDTLEYYDYEIERILEMAFQLAEKRRGKVTSVDKANVLEIITVMAADRHGNRCKIPAYYPGAYAGGYCRHAADLQSGWF